MSTYTVFVLILIATRGPVAVEGFDTRASCERELTLATNAKNKPFWGGHCVEVNKRER